MINESMKDKNIKDSPSLSFPAARFDKVDTGVLFTICRVRAALQFCWILHGESF